MEKDATISALRLLVQSCVDCEGEYEDCARHAQTAELRELFVYRAQACREEAAELEGVLRDLGGGSSGHRGSLLGAAHRGWMALRNTISSNGDGLLLEECEQGEDAVLMRYRGVLSGPLPESIRQLVLKHYELARQTREHLRALRARLAVAAG